jgi:phosphoglycolate phosphatase-like HAD superfamily hydrolase
MIGDILDDIEAGKRAGCHTILVNNGHETEWRMNEQRKPDYMAADLKEAAGIILHAQYPVMNEVSEQIDENESDRHL